MSLKLEEGDFKEAVRLACSEDTLADFGEVTFAALHQKHPPPHPASVIPPRPQPPLGVPTGPLVAVSEEEVACAIQSFPNGSAGGPDGLRSQHLKDIINPSANDGCQALLSYLTLFIKLVLEGDVPVSARPYFFGANLVALGKKDGGVRPIAVGCTLRRLVAKVAGRGVMEEMGALLSPRQLGYGVKKGTEATIHAAKLYLHSLDPSNAILKLDFKNAFNSIRRDKMLEAVQRLAPRLFSFVHSAYSSPSSLFWEDRVLQSAEGVQQGDPLGPLLFCLTIHQLCSKLKSELSLFYLDDGTLGGNEEMLRHDLEVVEREGVELGLKLNHLKSEVICSVPDIRNSILSYLPGARVVDPGDATLLGSPIGDVTSILLEPQQKDPTSEEDGRQAPTPLHA